MKKTTMIATALVMGAGASQAHAQALGLKGSDTLEEFTKCLIGDIATAGTVGSVSCPAPIAGFDYLGTGSTNGENALAAFLAGTGSQSTAPMSRPLRCTRLSGGDLNSVNGTAQGALVGLDGVVQVYGKYSGNTAAVLPQLTLAYSAYASGTDAALPPPYSASYGQAAGILRVLYFGRNANNTTDCNSAARNNLAANANLLFEGAGGPTGQLRHLFRRDDSSGTTDVFKTLSGFGGAFCNGTATQDNDPIRRNCASNEDVCQANGTLGLLLPIAVPADNTANPYSPGAVPTPANAAVGTTAANCGTPPTRCATGNFAYGSYPGLSACPDGATRLGGQCRIPRSSTNGWQCINTGNNRPSGSASAFDARVFNLVTRNDGTGVPIVNSLTSFFRLHETRAFHGCGCKDTDSTTQIGCLVSASDSALGYAGRESSQPNLNYAAALVNYSNPAAGGVLASDATIRDVLGGAPTYPYARKLYVNAVVPFANLTGDFGTLRDRVLNKSLIDPIATAVNFVTDNRGSSVALETMRGPAGGGNICQP